MVPAVAITNVLYDKLRGICIEQLHEYDRISAFALAASASSVVSGFLCYPLLYMRRNLQLPVEFEEQKTWKSIMRVSYARGGVREFYRGCGAHLLQLCPQMAVGMLLFETFRQKLSED